MSISSTTRKAGPYTGNGSTTVFPFSFKVFANTDLVVVKTNLSSVESTMVLTTDYTVALNADQDSNPGGTVTCVAAPASGFKITITSAVPELQPITLTNMGGFYPAVLNTALDRLTIFAQELKEQVSRAAKVPISSNVSTDQLSVDIIRLGSSADNIDAVANDLTNINSVAADLTNINTVASDVTNINIVAADKTNIDTVVTNIASINTNTANITSIQNAAANAAAAQAALNTFQGQYYGALSADPTVDPLGHAPTAGDLYFNSTTNELRVYSGTVWVAGSAGTMAVQNFTGDGATVAFTLPAAPAGANNTQVYIEGVYQQKNTYSIVNRTLTFTAAPDTGYSIEVVTISTLAIGNTDSALSSYVQGGTGSVTRTVQNRLRDFVSVKDFGAVGDGVTDDTAAIQAAINTLHDVYFPNGNYKISSTIYYAAHGQVLGGEQVSTWSNSPACSLTWAGTGGAMVSMATASVGYNNCTLRNIRLNGNNLANIGVDTTNSKATYRNLIERVYIEFINYGSTPTGIALGLGAFPNFGNDIIIRECYLGGCTIGVSGAGSTYQLLSTTMLGCATSIKAVAGAFFSLLNCVISGGATQFDVTSPQAINAVGCWFENSTTAIYKATTSHTVTFSGCYFHTLNATNLMDMGNAAGNFSLLNCYVPATSTSTLIKNINSTAEYSIIGTNCTIDTGYRLRAQGITRSDQASFAAGLTSDQANITGDGTTYSFNALAWTKDFDRATALNASTGVFTAPLYGDYQFTGQLSLSGLAAGHNDAQLILNAGGQDYMLARINPGTARTSGNELVMSGSKTVSLSAGQTVYLKLYVAGSTKVVGVTSGGTTVAWRTRFEGRII